MCASECAGHFAETADSANETMDAAKAKTKSEAESASLFMRFGASIAEKAVRRTPMGYVADSTRCVVSLGDAAVSLTKTEFALFSVLSERCGEPVSRSEIEERVWGGNISTNVCGVYVSYLRKKLSAIAGDSAVTSVRGRGYMLNIPVNKNEG